MVPTNWGIPLVELKSNFLAKTEWRRNASYLIKLVSTLAMLINDIIKKINNNNNDDDGNCTYKYYLYHGGNQGFRHKYQSHTWTLLIRIKD